VHRLFIPGAAAGKGSRGLDTAAASRTTNEIFTNPSFFGWMRAVEVAAVN